jgi:uracil-DNA glycosylase
VNPRVVFKNSCVNLGGDPAVRILSRIFGTLPTAIMYGRSAGISEPLWRLAIGADPRDRSIPRPGRPGRPARVRHATPAVGVRQGSRMASDEIGRAVLGAGVVSGRMGEVATEERPGAQRFVPDGAGLERLRAAAAGCKGCELYSDATQTVFSAGSATARIVLVGEQPGDVEDRQGVPFVGPAGKLLGRALEDAGIDRSLVYVTNSVKHFRHLVPESPTKRRIHQTPDDVHIEACKPWLLAELALIDPEVVVLLGATAGRTLLGPAFRVTRDRGRLIPRPGRADEPASVQLGWILATLHPSAILRADNQETAYAEFVADLKVATLALGQAQSAAKAPDLPTSSPANSIELSERPR